MFRWFDPSMTIPLTIGGVLRGTRDSKKRARAPAKCAPTRHERVFSRALPSRAQVPEDKPIPILSGSIGTFSFVTAGQNAINTQINPVLLVPLGDRWLIESRAEFEGQFQRPPAAAPTAGLSTSMWTTRKLITSRIRISR